jgi:hypothetical protein
MTKRNKRSIEKTKSIPIIIKSSQSDSFVETKCNCGENVVEGSIGCHRFPECCDNDLVLVELTDYEDIEFI